MLQPGRSFETRVRVAYADTDQMAMAYHANYLVWFERGRTEAMRDLGLTYAALEARGLFLPVVEAGLRFRAPARYDDVLAIETVVAALGGASVTFRYRVRRAEEGDGPALVQGFTEHACATRDGRVVRLPGDVRAIIEPVVATGGSRARRAAPSR